MQLHDTNGPPSTATAVGAALVHVPPLARAARRRALLLAVVVLWTGAAACSVNAGPRAPAEVGAAPASADLDVARSEAGSVAASYMRALLQVDFAEASKYVVADQRGVVEALGLSSGPGTVTTTSGEVTIGQIDVRGNVATAIFLGRMCRTTARQSASDAGEECIENKDLAAESPAFTVHLVRAAGTWQVALPQPGGA